MIMMNEGNALSMEKLHRDGPRGRLILNNFESLIVGVGVIFHPYCNSILMGYATGHCVNKSPGWGELIFRKLMF